MRCINIYIYNNILQKISSQKSFMWESENNHKKITILESFVTVGSFDYDHILMNMLHVNMIIAIVHLIIVEDLEGSIGG
jgi:hypothetical protein